MKKWIFLGTLFFQLSVVAWGQSVPEALGGVDVGNGRVVAGMFEGFFPKEEKLILKVQSTLQKLKNGRHERVLLWIEQGQCRSQMTYDSTEVVSSYRPVGNTWQKGVTGYTRVILQDCQTPFNIDADEPPLYEEDGFESIVAP